MSDIRIVCGDPIGDKPASFTRFVLPFAYKLEATNAPEEGKPFYECDLRVCECLDEKCDYIWRRRYLTDETEEVLFRRAKWFNLTNWKEQSQKVGRVIIRAPQIVLFEFNATHEKPELMQTGFLIVEVFYPQSGSLDRNGHDLGASLDEFMSFNELFRYWQKPFVGHEKKDSHKNQHYEKVLGEFPIDPISFGKKISEAADKDDIYFHRWEQLLFLPVKSLDGKWLKIFPDTWRINARNRIVGIGADNATGGINNSKNDTTDWIVHADNRTFVWTCALVGKQYIDGHVNQDNTLYGADVLKKDFHPGYKKIRATDYGYWIKLLNVDSPDGNGCRDFEKKWANERTYKRWEEWGSFYGYTPHSGVLLGAPLNEVVKPYGTPLWKHFGGMYFDQTLLLLYLKTTLFRFSLELNKITAEAMKRTEKGNDDEWVKDFQKLRWKFSLFSNLYQFPMLSNQQQGLEMYSLQRKSMDVDDLFAEIKDEIHSSYEYLVVKQDMDQTETTTQLTVVATVGLVFALTFSFLAIPSFSENGYFITSGKLSLHKIYLPIITIILFSIFVFVIIYISHPIAKLLKNVASKERLKR